ncbi:hypothetical protein UVI_02002530 [Ustilaginoidea virens]|uniref:Uncharacterized protein n=1 Tax=Ustilaginoidea virens TaxID=1159556 RepID=A0A1B5L000_USTVR|nr:hypothetical protein UVI_02002530 [Ustilaginoidea virens]
MAEEKQPLVNRRAARGQGQPQPVQQSDHVEPLAYGQQHGHVLIEPRFDAGAKVTDHGRVNISLDSKNRRLADLLPPVFNSQASTESEPQAAPPHAFSPPGLDAEPARLAPPRLNVVIQIVGSRGDVQPFVALGKVIKEVYGHRIRIATHPNFRSFVEDHGLEFFSIGGDPAELMAFMVKHPGLTPGMDALKSGEIGKRRRDIQKMLIGCWRSCIEAGDGMGPPEPHLLNKPLDLSSEMPGDAHAQPFVADAIIANPPSFAHIHVAEKLGIPVHMMFTSVSLLKAMPWSPTRAFPHPLATIQSSNADDMMTNYITYTLVEMITWQGLGDIVNRFRENVLGLASLSLFWAPGLINRLKVPYTYCWSRAVLPKPKDWGEHIDISGFYFLNLASSYTPEPDLVKFLESSPPPVYIGFGSIVVDDPNALTRTIFDAVHLAGVKALVSKGWGGLGGNEVVTPNGVYMLDDVPHDWLFEHVSAVVHHGGAGTTASGLKAGKPTVVVPFFGDQPFWGAVIARARAGVNLVRHENLTAEKLAEAIEFCLQPDTQERAKELGQKIREEAGSEVGASRFHKHLDLDSMRCSVAPSRAATWRIIRTDVQLSPFAMTVLVNAGLLEYKDVKLKTDLQEPESLTSSDLTRGSTGAPKDATSKVELTNIEPESAFAIVQKTDATVLGTPSKARSGYVSSADGQQPLWSRQELFPTLANLETAIETGRSVAHVVSMGMKSPMNLCLGLARGFRNIPRIYNDDTIRLAGKVTDFNSGIRIASKELGLGLVDGITGLVMQPMKGAEKGGAGGFVKGVGKGIGGLVAKPAAGIWGFPAYMMQGIHAEMQRMMTKSVTNYITTSRIVQGLHDFSAATEGEKADIIIRWNNLRRDLQDCYDWKRE